MAHSGWQNITSSIGPLCTPASNLFSLDVVVEFATAQIEHIFTTPPQHSEAKYTNFVLVSLSKAVENKSTPSTCPYNCPLKQNPDGRFEFEVLFHLVGAVMG